MQIVTNKHSKREMESDNVRKRNSTPGEKSPGLHTERVEQLDLTFTTNSS